MSTAIESTPAADGFRMPAEFEPHDGCWMVWPRRPDNWRLGAGPAQEAFAAVAAAISAAEPVTVAVSEPQLERAHEVLPSAVEIVAIESDDAWARDTGPTFVVDGGGGRRGVDWRFNAWGGIYSPWDHDERLAARVLEVEGADRYRAPLVLEGGSIHVDGEGTVLTTEECLLNPNRNPELSREEIERALLEYLGAEKVVWLGRGVYEDETDGHVDNLACFARPGLVLLTWSEDEPIPSTGSQPTPWRGWRRRPTPAAVRSRWCASPPPGRCTRRPRRRRGSSRARRRCRAAPATGSPPPTRTSTSPTGAW